jgi:hypothetical protein
VTDQASLSLSPPRALYGALMAVACVVAAGVAAGANSALGGDGRTGLLAAITVATGSGATFIPAVFARRLDGRAANFGVQVFFASALRALLIFGIAFTLDASRDLGAARRPFWIATLCGAALVLVAESSVAIVLLARIERLRSGLRPVTSG